MSDSFKCSYPHMLENSIIANGQTQDIISNYSAHSNFTAHSHCNLKHNDSFYYIDISNMNVEGLLNLSSKILLEVLICNNNNINKITGLSQYIKFLNCSNNNISELIFSENSMRISYNYDYSNVKLNCEFNPISKIINAPCIPINNSNCLEIMIFGSIFNQPVDNLPQSIKKLKFNVAFNQSIDNLPLDLESLDLTHCKRFVGSLNNLPLKLKELFISYHYNQPINNLPINLNNLYFGYHFNQLINNWPNNLTNLVMGNAFNEPIDNLPNQLKILKCGYKFNQFVDNLPDGLIELIFGNNFDKPIDNLPNQLKILQLGTDFNQSINNLPSSLNYLILHINLDFNMGDLPNNLTHLFLKNSNKDRLRQPITKLPEKLIYFELPAIKKNLINLTNENINSNCYINYL